jgi:Tn3 transposase DDE domain
LAVALRELGRIERSLFTLDWLQNVELRRGVHAGLNKGEARNALARACSSTGSAKCATAALKTSAIVPPALTLMTAAIVLWNTVYLERAIQTIRNHGQPLDENLLQHVSPLGWEHINLTSDYVWIGGWEKGNSGLFERSPRLSVLYIPFREATPKRAAS